MRIARAVVAGMFVAVVTTAAGFALTTKPVAADMQMGTTCTTWGVSLSIAAQNNTFDKDCLAAPPGQAFTIIFDNRDAIAHNIVILPQHESSEVLFRGEVITGPRSVTYSVGPLPPGSYHFHCEVHQPLMMGTFVAGGTAAITSAAGMSMPSASDTMMSSPGASKSDAETPGVDAAVQPTPSQQGRVPMRSVLLLVGVACCAGGLVVAGRSRRAGPRTSLEPETMREPSATAVSDAHVGRRQLAKLGAAGVAGAAVAKMAASQAWASDADRVGGIHISVPSQIVGPEAAKGFPHHWTLTVYGPDNALSGMGWGGATDLKTEQDVLNSKMFPCIYSLTGAVEGDLVKVHGLMLFSGAPDQGLPLTFEGNLKTGALHVNAYNTLDFEGTGIIARI